VGGWHWRWRRAGLSGSIGTDDAVDFRSYRDFTACSEKLRASLNARVVADDFDDRELVGSGVADAGTPAGDRVADDLIAVAAVKPVDRSRQNGFVEGKSQQHAANVFHVRHVFGEPRRTVGRWQRVLEGEFPRPRFQLRDPIGQVRGWIEP